MSYKHFSGVFSLLLTPFNYDGTIDWTAYERYLEWQLDMEPDGLFAVCGTSEMKWLTGEERLELARRAVALSGATPVVATGNLGPDAANHRDELRAMADTGVAGGIMAIVSAAERLLSLSNPPTAIIAINDLLAIATLRAAADRGLSVPRDLSVAGFDDIPFARYFTPRLTTVRRESERIGERAFELLLERMENPQLPQRTEAVHPRLVPRESTGPALSST